ncbi:MAG: hypothetical protein PHY45_05990 [Rhodocyclaceae bacterium]|nr:hypothetical protein [Rhodocyclaceae bacterium]
MTELLRQTLRVSCGALALAFVISGAAHADSRNLAPGFTSLPKGVKLVVMPPDVELFSVSAGGVPEPRADWTEAAQHNIHAAVNAKSAALGLVTQELADDDADDLAEVNALHGAVARSIALHHMGGGNLALPTKGNKLDWSLGDAVAPIRARSGADYALFIWMRDSYATSERKVAMFALALFGVGITGGIQIGYASLVDLHTGRVVWFNRLLRGTGDLRETEAANETVKSLLAQFPESP